MPPAGLPRPWEHGLTPEWGMTVAPGARRVLPIPNGPTSPVREKVRDPMSETTTRPRRPFRRVVFRVLAGLAALFLLAVVLLDGFGILRPKLPEPRPVASIVMLPQDGSLPADPGWHWDDAGRNWFHHAAQGTTVMPYEWLIALEQPDVGIFRPIGLFLDPAFMSRFGFLPGGPDPDLNPDGRLPIGWAINKDFDDPTGNPGNPDAYNAKPYNAVGLTCAACHTGRVTYLQPGGKTVDLLIEGGSAMIDIRQLQSAIGRAMAYTLYVPFSFDRFAARVLGKDNTLENRGRLRTRVKSWFDEALASQNEDDKRHVNQLESGFARTDALTLIGNRVFGPIDQGNVISAGAPVNYPHIWGASWFDWVQYNASIRMVMVRNIGEALGVGARTNVTPGDARLFQSTVNVPRLHEIESQLGGAAPYRGLLAPRWEDAVKLAGFPPLKPELVAAGKDLYATYCLKCHGPTVEELKKDLASPKPAYWTDLEGPSPYDKRFLKTWDYDLGKIGTDPAQAADFASRFAEVPDPYPDETKRALAALKPRRLLGGGPTGSSPASSTAPPVRTITLSASKGLRVITEVIRERAYKTANLTAAQQAEWDRYRDDKPGLPDSAIIVANLKYKARPLDGVWATPPYLHNTSVPNLDALLSPVSARPGSFPIGTTAYDTDLVGFRTDEDPGSFTLDTTLSGNYNTGHEFRDLTLLELEVHSKTADLLTDLPVDARWARLLKVSPEDYTKLSDEDRGKARRKLTEAALETGKFFGVIGPGLKEDERKAIIEYVKSL
jgi:mono/diheme cytochrome c family protein